MISSKIIFISHSDINPKEGGMARNFAFYHEMKKRGARIYNYTSKGIIKRFFLSIGNILMLLNMKNKTILLTQNAMLLYVFPFRFFKYGAYRNFVVVFLDFLSKRNNLFIEINDLLYEQSIDLGLKVNPFYFHYEKMIFSQKKINFIFASKMMGNYVHEVYGLNKNNYQVILNGGPNLKLNIIQKNDINFVQNKINCIYAGTLNKGRQIEQLLNIFKDNNKTQLILIGDEGEWINNLFYDNIKYLGRYSEEEALFIASKCDIGVIPYSEDKKYYNICYPTKNSFYITAGIPILCTRLDESIRVFSKYSNAATFLPIEGWADFLNTISKEEILDRKVYIDGIKNEFSWEYLLKSMNLNIGQI